MSRLFKKVSKKVGLPPGALVHVGDEKTEEIRITIITYDEGQFQEKEVKTVEECFPVKDKPIVTWINIDGIHQVDIIEKMGKHFDLHPLILEDIMHAGQRPKVQVFNHFIYVVLKMFMFDESENEIQADQVSLIIGSNFVVSFQEKQCEIFEHVKEMIRKSNGRIRKMGADYLAYALLDAIVDQYFVILEKIGEMIELIEEELVTKPEPNTLQTIHNMKREIILLRKSIWPLREVINSLGRGESPLIQESTTIYLRDVYDHTIQVIDTIETFRDMVSGMLDIYLSSVSNKMNEVMKVLTIIATIFIPLTFIAGIYGMNFEYMPELGWEWSYPLVWIIMIGIGFSMLLYFKKKQWL
ncbi:MAG: Cobalt/magnesium transport protein CorA [Candidatus Methanocomedens sp.]|nr:MAG: Cobalt/magnesium transport protein CorA [ANME-2 cluster archaeon]